MNKRIFFVLFLLSICFLITSCSKSKKNKNTSTGEIEYENSVSEPEIIIEKNPDGSFNYDKVTVKFPSGTVFIGKTDKELNFIEGQLSYNNKNQIYTGSLNNNCQPHGFGKMVFENGTIFEGNWDNGELRGYGKKTYSDGSIIEGNFVGDKIVYGKDSYIQWANGASYRGQTDENGVFNGNGKFIFEDGTSYEGTFIDNHRTGFGKSDYNGSQYIGYYQGDYRTGKGDFSFSNGYEYKGNFQEGTFSGTGYLLAQEKEKIIYASNDWDGTELKKGKIITENGDVWEGGIENSQPVAGTGIWTTQKERLAKLQKKGNFCQQVTYTINDNTIIVASVYTPEEINQIIHSANYLRDFDNFYKLHKETFDRVITGIKVISGILAISPTPIAPLAAAVNIGVSMINISLKTMDTGFDYYDALKSGNNSIIKNIALDYGKDVAGELINIMFMGTAVSNSGIGQGTEAFMDSIVPGIVEKLNSFGLNPTIATELVYALFDMSSLTSSYANEFFAEHPSLSAVNSVLQLITPIVDLPDSELASQGLRLFDLSA